MPVPFVHEDGCEGDVEVKVISAHLATCQYEAIRWASRRTYVVQATSVVAVRDDLYRSIRAIRHIQAVGQHDTTFGPAEVPWSVLLYRRTDDGVEAAANIVTNSEGNGDEVLCVAQLEGDEE